MWKNIEINDSLVKARTAKSVLIAFMLDTVKAEIQKCKSAKEFVSTL